MMRRNISSGSKTPIRVVVVLLIFLTGVLWKLEWESKTPEPEGSGPASEGSRVAVNSEEQEQTTSSPSGNAARGGAPLSRRPGTDLFFPDESAPLAPNPLPPSLVGVDPRFIQPATRLDKPRRPQELREVELAAARKRDATRKAEAWAWAEARGKPTKGVGFELMYLDENGRPVYYTIDNREARISHNVHRLNQLDGPGFLANLSGFRWTVGMWESGPPRVTHEEFLDSSGDFRVQYRESGGNLSVNDSNDEDHATHVLGTLIGDGSVDQNARGMAWLAQAHAYDWNSDFAEMSAAGASTISQLSDLHVSNHSYGTITGWNPPRDLDGDGDTDTTWEWFGEGGDAEPENFGRYNTSARNADRAVVRAPYLLPFKAAGNSRGIEPPDGVQAEWPLPGGGTFIGETGTNSSQPAANGEGLGYDTIPTWGNSKNIVTVGNMLDAVTDGARDAGYGMVSSSSFGPSDDGRIKPDLVANGADVLSATQDSDTSTGRKTGTSMASPGAAGTGLLLQEHYHDTTGGLTMRASTLKALMIHTATDVQFPGPDYASGWGLVDGLAGVEHLNRHAAQPLARHLVADFLSDDVPTYQFTFEARVGELVKATLVWTDPEGLIRSGLDNRNKCLINDLDLTIRLPDGTVKKAAKLNPLSTLAPATYDGNDTDNVEVVGAPGDPIFGQPGKYEILIRHKGTLREFGYRRSSSGLVKFDLPNPRQIFSLMVEGNKTEPVGTIAEALEQNDVFDGQARVFTIPPDADAGFGLIGPLTISGGDRADSLNIGDSEVAAFETRVTGPISLSFDWFVSSEEGFDFLRFLVDGILVEEISGDVGTTRVSRNLPAGDHVLRWEYRKDSSVSNGADLGGVDNLQFSNLNEGLDNFDYVWTEDSFSNAPWILEQTDGGGTVRTGDLARSGDISSGGSSMQTTINGPAVVRVRMVQTGNGSFSVNYGAGQEIVHRTGNAWRRYTFELRPGPQTVTFRHQLGTQAGFARVDEFEVFPMTTSINEGANLTPGPEIGNLSFVDEQAGWVSDSADGAPISGTEKDPEAIRTIFSDDPQIAGIGNLLELTVSGPGVLSFWWQATGDANAEFNLLRSTDGINFSFASPENGTRRFGPLRGGDGWQQIHYEVPPGSQTMRWRYLPGSSRGSGWLDRISYTKDSFAPARGVDRWGSPWTTLGDATWFGQFDASTDNRIDSTTHAPISDGQATSLATEIVGPVRLSFRWKVSSEAGFDFLRFWLNGEEELAISGEQDWATVDRILPAGLNTLRWEYQKDGSVSLGLDRGWLDEVVFLRPDFGIAGVELFGDIARVNVRKDATAGFFLERSSDLVNWVPAITANNGMILPRFTEVSLIVSAPGDSNYYRVGFKPEYFIPVENAGFEEPRVSVNAFLSNFPGWGPLDDGFTITSQEHIPGFASSGTQHLSIAANAFAETRSEIAVFRGVHTALIDYGNRPGFTSSFGPSRMILQNDFTGAELTRQTLRPESLPDSLFITSYPLSTDHFPSSPDTILPLRLRLEATFDRAFFDQVRILSEPQ